ncbi:MAG: formylglycine-generating enzyme family protein [Verrucomicrobia bacterium]|nr:formylglycine-generating enzyme family protein [Verrucomicrobiota bacterium]
MSLSKSFQGFPSACAWIAMMSLLTGGIPLLAAENNVFRNSLGMEFREVAGTRVKFSVWETRVMDWEAYLKAKGLTWDHKLPFPQDGMHPAVNITLKEALAFCEWLTETEQAALVINRTQSYRLPTNLEWDVAAGLQSAQDVTRTVTSAEPDDFPWGHEWPPPRDAGNYNAKRIEGAESDEFRYTAPVGRFKPSPDGLYDLGGNAWEWVCDVNNGANSAGVLRGGSWMHWRRDFLASSYKLEVKDNARSPGMGFRCVLEDTFYARAMADRDEAAARARRTQILQKPKVPEEEVRKVVAQRNAEAASAAETKKNAVTLASIGKAAITMAVAGKPFDNSLNMKMLPLPGQNSLLGEHEVRVTDFRRFILANTRSSAEDAYFRKNPDHPATYISWTEATDFCVWLTARERLLGMIPPDASYRLPKTSEWRLAAAAGNVTADPSQFVWGSAWPPPAGVVNIQSSGLKDVKFYPAGHNGFFDLA